jgi:hypothetical protein
MATSENLDAGDGGRYRGQTVTLDAGSNSVSGGQAVKFDGSGYITPTTANSEDLIGVVANEDKSASDSDSKYTVHIAGHVVAVDLASDGTASAGDTLIPSGTDNGDFDGVDGAMYQAVDEGGTATYDLYLNHPFALEDGGNDDTILAVMR